MNRRTSIKMAWISLSSGLKIRLISAAPPTFVLLTGWRLCHTAGSDTAQSWDDAMSSSLRQAADDDIGQFPSKVYYTSPLMSY